MSLPNQFPGQKSYTIVCGGDINDPDQQKLSLLKLIDPLRHGKDITPDQLPHVGIERPATQACLEQFNAPPEQGTCVVSTFNMGDPTSRTCVGMPTEYFASENLDGNLGLYDELRKAAEKSAKKRVKPQVVERMINNVLVRDTQEKNQEWKHSLTKGLATHAAWHPMVGQLLNEVKNIETALQNFANIPGLGALGQLPGNIMNIASIFKNLNNNQKKQATQNMSPLLIEGLENMMLIMSDVQGGTQYVSSDRINPEVFTRNMIDLLSQVDNISDMIDVINRLQYDETIRGLEEYSEKANTGILASTTNTEEILEYSTLQLNKFVQDAIEYFDEGYSLNIASNTYIVLDALQSSNTINVFPKIEKQLSNETIYVYLPVSEYETEGPYGPMTMSIDMNGNVKPNKSSADKLQQAMQAFQSLMSSAEAGKNFLFGDAAGIMGQLFNRIPNNIRSSILTEIAQVAKQKLDMKDRKTKGSSYPFK